MQVYSKRNEKTRPMFTPDPSSTDALNSYPQPRLKLDTQSGNSSDLELPIALRKGTGHVLLVIQFNILLLITIYSPTSSSFVVKLSLECIPKYATKAVSHPK